MNLRRNKKTAEVTTDVVAQLQHRTQQAQALDSVPRQELLSDPRLNPETRALADELTARRLRTELDLEHKRQLRRARERDRVEERAARRTAAIDDAREATSNENTVLDMTRSRKRFTLGALGASLICSVGSALGVEAVAQAAGAAAGVGYIAEVTMTGMATMAIAWRGGLARSNAVIEGLPVPVLNAMIAIPLLASIVASTAGSGLIGAVCSIGAGLFAWMAYLISVTGAEAVTQAVGRMDAEQASERTSVTATEVPTENEDQEREEPTAQLPRRTPGDGLAVVGDAIADEAADYLKHQGENASSPAVVPPGDDGPTGAAHPIQEGEDDASEAPASLADAARRRSHAAAQRVADYFAEHPEVPVKTAAKALGLDPKTVRKYRPGGAS